MPHPTAPVAGPHALLLDQIGRAYAQAMRASRAPHQNATDSLPPEMVGAPPGGAGPRFGPRFVGANALALRLAMSEKGQTDPRHATVARAAYLNRQAGSSRRSPILTGSAPGALGSLPRPVTVASHRGVAIPGRPPGSGPGLRSGGRPGRLRQRRRG